MPYVGLHYDMRAYCPKERRVASDDLIPMEGEVMEVFPSGTFSVKTEKGSLVMAHLAGKMRQNKIRVVLGDRVTVEVSPYDLSKGRLIYRHK